MKSRVERNQSLYEKISHDTESDLSNSSLGSISDHLNSIDQSFEKIDTTLPQDHNPQHAREVKIEDESPAVEPGNSPEPHQEDKENESNDELRELLWNTFENKYIDEFLKEVKQYNVKKGYRNLENTQSNIMSELNLDDAPVLKTKPTETILREAAPDTIEFAEPNEPDVHSEDVQSVTPEPIENTMVYDFSKTKDKVEAIEDDEKTIALEVQKLFSELTDFSGDILSDTPDPAAASANVEPIALEEEASYQTARETQLSQLMESTQTLQLKLDETERDLQTINNNVASTHRILNFVIYVLVLAIITIIALLVWTLLK